MMLINNILTLPQFVLPFGECCELSPRFMMMANAKVVAFVKAFISLSFASIGHTTPSSVGRCTCGYITWVLKNHDVNPIHVSHVRFMRFGFLTPIHGVIAKLALVRLVVN